MGILSRFESRVEDKLEGAAGRFVEAPISPVQIAKKAEKQMRREKLVGAGKQYAPTLYTVLVNPEDDDRLFGYYPTLAGETETYLSAKAADEGLSMDGQPLVRFIVDESLRRGKFEVIAEMVAAPIIAELRQEEMERYGLTGAGAQAFRPAVAGSYGQPVQAHRARQAQGPNGGYGQGQPYFDGYGYGQPQQGEIPYGIDPNLVGQVSAAEYGANPYANNGGYPDFDNGRGGWDQPAQNNVNADGLPGCQSDYGSDQAFPQEVGGADFSGNRPFDANAPKYSDFDCQPQDDFSAGYANDQSQGFPSDFGNDQPFDQPYGQPQANPYGQASADPYGNEAFDPFAPQGEPIDPAFAQVAAASAPRTMVFGAVSAAQAAPTYPQYGPRAQLHNLTNHRSHTITGSRAIIGRSTASDITVSDVNASRTHAELFLDRSGAWKIRDLGSTNGLYVNGYPEQETTLNYGDRITIGTTNFEFVFE